MEIRWQKWQLFFFHLFIFFNYCRVIHAHTALKCRYWRIVSLKISPKFLKIHRLFFFSNFSLSLAIALKDIFAEISGKRKSAKSIQYSCKMITSIYKRYNIISKLENYLNFMNPKSRGSRLESQGSKLAVDVCIRVWSDEVRPSDFR